MAFQLPLFPSVANYQVGVLLDETQYLLNIRWNGRDEAWYMDILLEDETPVRNGLKVVLGQILGRQSVDPNMPTGQLVVADTSNEGRDAGFDDLGDRVQIFYFTAEEVAAL